MKRSACWVIFFLRPIWIWRELEAAIVHLWNIEFCLCVLLSCVCFRKEQFSNRFCSMVGPVGTLHRLAKLNYFRHPPDFVVVGGNSPFDPSTLRRWLRGELHLPCCCEVWVYSGQHFSQLLSSGIRRNQWARKLLDHKSITKPPLSHGKVHWREGNAVKPATWDPHVVEAGCTVRVWVREWREGDDLHNQAFLSQFQIIMGVQLWRSTPKYRNGASLDAVLDLV